MATLRKITVVSSMGNSEFMSAVDTGAELINAFSSNGVEYNSNLRVMLRTGQGSATAITESSSLPEGDLIIFLTPKKVKSGKKA